MRIGDYLKEKAIFIIIEILILIFTAMILKALSVDLYAIIFIVILNFAAFMGFYMYDYITKSKYYKKVYDNLDSLDKKYLLSELISEGDFLESKILYDILTQTNKSMNDEIGRFINDKQEYKEYIEMWIHEIKTPIAAIKLIIDNNKSMVTSNILNEIEKVENYIDQSLFYSKSSQVDRDYIIKKLNLKECINNVVIRNSNTLIDRHIRVKIMECEEFVFCDKKWIEFILHQIVSNSIKYIEKTEGEILFQCKNNNGEIVLNISDTGIGISEKSLASVFNKGFTGENGRKFRESTGFGLYLSKKLCDSLGLGISITSKEGVGTTVSILFPKNNMYLA
ncbi:histidine kinase [Clostridium carboxidivorans P7]|uniref:histidine kinase n=1 Tax=Clostridium carboxidivorans P7 TaxID=536227 RepID=C6PWZ2_9CLOT|nr:sensor histidine kinase [Clostridium carboxidivorans]AKN30103.1 histidine kinase [Clostridium carboxidivorans P7]EET86229.1 histidine kinase [Clostridium carboxidivorans P7]EFG86453.1 ATPase, histidine kinase-, DNA gyrase B-, and HSP90-like domain protein [Clostridium carboxidivorans P7]